MLFFLNLNSLKIEDGNSIFFNVVLYDMEIFMIFMLIVMIFVMFGCDLSNEYKIV